MSFKWWVLIATCLLALGIITGLVLPANIATLLEQELANLEELGAALEPSQVSTAIFILIKNILALLLSFIFSPVLCLLPALSLVVNGWLLSLVSVIIIQEESLGFLLAGLLPHGIFELPALIIGEAAALSFGVTVMRALIPKGKKLLIPKLKKNLKCLALACILLVPAAIIETYITPLLIR